MKGQCSGIYRAISDEHASLPGSSCAKRRRALVRPAQRIDCVCRRHLRGAVSSERGANTRNCPSRPIVTPAVICQRRISRNVTTLHCRKQEASARGCEREGTAAQHRGRRGTTNRHVTLHGIRLREFGKTVSELRVEAKARTRLCDAPQLLSSRARSYASSQESPVLRRLRTHLNYSEPEKKPSECDLRTYVGRNLIGRRSDRCVAPGTRPIARAIPELSGHSLNSNRTARWGQIRFRKGHELCSWIWQRAPKHSHFGDRPTTNSWTWIVCAGPDRCVPAAVAAPQETLLVVRVRGCEPQRVARPRPHRTVPVGPPESSAQCEQRFPPLPARRRLGRTLFEDWRFHSVAQVRSLPSYLLKTLLDIRAAAGCCSWNLPGWCGSRLGEKRKRNLAFTARTSMVPASQYLRKQKCSAVGIPSFGIWPSQRRGVSRYFSNVGRQTRFMKVADRNTNRHGALSSAWPHVVVSTIDDATRR
jgi:hypothetical protein